jgi:hypothetical protein
VSQGQGQYTVTLKTSQLARNVYVAFGDLDYETSDNYFDMLPGEQITLSVKSPATLDQIKGSLKVVSLTDAFNAK